MCSFNRNRHSCFNVLWLGCDFEKLDNILIGKANTPVRAAQELCIFFTHKEAHYPFRQRRLFEITNKEPARADVAPTVSTRTKVLSARETVVSSFMAEGLVMEPPFMITNTELSSRDPPERQASLYWYKT